MCGKLGFAHCGLARLAMGDGRHQERDRIPVAASIPIKVVYINGLKDYFDLRGRTTTTRPFGFCLLVQPLGIATTRPSAPCLPVPPGGIATTRPSLPCRLVQPFRIGTTRPSAPCRLVAPGGIGTTRPSLPSRAVHPLRIATTRPSAPCRLVAPAGMVTECPSDPVRLVVIVAQLPFWLGQNMCLLVPNFNGITWRLF